MFTHLVRVCEQVMHLTRNHHRNMRQIFPIVTSPPGGCQWGQMSVWKGRGVGVRGWGWGPGYRAPHLAQVHLNFVGVTGTQAIITGKVSIDRGWVGGARKPGTRCSFGSKRNLVRTSKTLYCFLSAGIEAGARDTKTVTYLFALLKNSERIIETKSRKRNISTLTCFKQI